MVDLLFTPCYYRQLYEVMKSLQFDDLLNLSLTDKKIRTFCKYDKLTQDLFIEKEVEKYLQTRFVKYGFDELPFMIAIQDGNHRVVSELIKRGFDPSYDDNWAIRAASEKGNIRMVNLLLEDDRVDPSANDNYAIRFASSGGHLQVVERLLQDERVDPSGNYNQAIIWHVNMVISM